MTTFTVSPRGPYSLRAGASFLEGFAPAAHQAVDDARHLHLAFVADGGEEVAGVCLHAEDTIVVGEVFGEADPAVVRSQVERILSLDVDGSDFPAVGEHDPVVGRLQARYPGLRPVCFFSPYEAAAWTVISQRVRIPQAARIKARMTQELGPTVQVHGERLEAFPGPVRLLQLEGFRGLFGRKIEYLHSIADATLEGRLDARRLRSMPQDVALKELKTIPGIGDFGAHLVLLRGAGAPDALPTSEPRLSRAVALAYGLKALPSPQELKTLSERWRPYRTWVSFLLRKMLEDETHEIAGGPRRSQEDEVDR